MFFLVCCIHVHIHVFPCACRYRWHNLPEGPRMDFSMQLLHHMSTVSIFCTCIALDICTCTYGVIGPELMYDLSTNKIVSFIVKFQITLNRGLRNEALHFLSPSLSPRPTPYSSYAPPPPPPLPTFLLLSPTHCLTQVYLSNGTRNFVCEGESGSTGSGVS